MVLDTWCCSGDIVVLVLQHKPSSSQTSHSVQVELTDACPTFVCRCVHCTCDRKFCELRRVSKATQAQLFTKPESNRNRRQYGITGSQRASKLKKVMVLTPLKLDHSPTKTSRSLTYICESAALFCGL